MRAIARSIAAVDDPVEFVRDGIVEPERTVHPGRSHVGSLGDLPESHRDGLEFDRRLERVEPTENLVGSGGGPLLLFDEPFEVGSHPVCLLGRRVGGDTVGDEQRQVVLVLPDVERL